MNHSGNRILPQPEWVRRRSDRARPAVTGRIGRAYFPHCDGFK
jgi:hypothetical protein